MAEITITETDRRRSTARILDVREDFEVAEGMIPGALHIPMANSRPAWAGSTRPSP
jgi:rhodanese-related sulfurtransferase